MEQPESMADTPSPDSSSPPPDGFNADALSEEEIDKLLTDASALASELAAELGESEVRAHPPIVDTPAGAEQASVDESLAQTESLIGEAKAELADEPTSDARTDGPVSSSTKTNQEVGPTSAGGRHEGPPDPSTADPAAIPDFMQEFTRPADTIPATAPDATPQAPSGDAQPVPDFMAEFTRPEEESSSHESEQNTEDERQAAGAGAFNRTKDTSTSQTKPLGVVGNIPHPARREPTSVHDDEAIEAVGEEPRVPGLADVPDRPRTPSRIGALAARSIGPPVWSGLERAAWMLERMDRPLRFVGQRARVAIGYLALATFGTSLITLLISLL